MCRPRRSSTCGSAPCASSKRWRSRPSIRNSREERQGLIELLGSDEKQWDTISGEIKDIKKQFGKSTPLGKRKTGTAALPQIDVSIEEALIEKEPVTIVLSEKGWIRALKGHDADLAKLAFKTDDSLKYAIKAQTTDKLVLFATNGKFYTLDVNALPGGRGQGEPVRLMIDLDETDEILEGFVHKPGRKLLVASNIGNGFIVAEDEVVAQTRKGKQIPEPLRGRTRGAVPAGSRATASRCWATTGACWSSRCAEVNEMDARPWRAPAESTARAGWPTCRCSTARLDCAWAIHRARAYLERTRGLPWLARAGGHRGSQGLAQEQSLWPNRVRGSLSAVKIQRLMPPWGASAPVPDSAAGK